MVECVMSAGWGVWNVGAWLTGVRDLVGVGGGMVQVEATILPTLYLVLFENSKYSLEYHYS